MGSTAPIAPVLSVCIPAYGFEEGVTRIIKALGTSDRLEVLISEDKSDRPLNLADLAQEYTFVHKVNDAPEGAVSNWNRVMSWATGDYVWLLHHDEEPRLMTPLEDFLDLLATPDAPCVLVSRLDGTSRWWQRALKQDGVRSLFARFPRLTLLHNSIGAPSNIILRRSHFEKFDERLKWYVDTEWYFRLFSRCKDVSFADFEIQPHTYEQSITQSIRDDVFDISISEINEICDKNAFSAAFRYFWSSKVRLFETAKKIASR